jgi:hypothetical protein
VNPLAATGIHLGVTRAIRQRQVERRLEQRDHERSSLVAFPHSGFGVRTDAVCVGRDQTARRKEVKTMSTATIGSAAQGKTVAMKLTGWTVFSSVVLLVIGGLNLINGFTALNHSGYYTREIVYSNLTFWGWAFVIWGAAQILAGAVTLAHHEWGAYLGIGLAATSALLWFFLIFAAPFAALLGVTVSMLVVGGFTAGMHPDEY